MSDFWIKAGCFLTGYNYALVRNSSEATAKAVKKYFSALIIISTLWAFIGYSFTQRYLHGSKLASICGAILMVVIVIQIERQIILTVGKNKWAVGFRILIGVVMAIIGSIILDQVMFKDDVEKVKITRIQDEVAQLMPLKTQELSIQILQLEKSISSKENERVAIISDLTTQPTIPTPTTTTEYTTDTATGKLVMSNKSITTSSVVNPKAELIPQIDNQIKNLNSQKAQKENDKLNIQQLLEDELKSKVGFLDELKILFSILFSSKIALFVWSLIFLFFLSIELFIVVNKFGENINDYEKTVMHQLETRILMLERLADKRFYKTTEN